MLQSIRDRTSGIVAGFIIALLVVPFAFWGIQSFSGGGGDPVVVKVGSEKIKESQFRRAYEQRYQQYLQLMGDNFNAADFKQAEFQKTVLDDMTRESQLRQHADKLGYHADDASLFKSISAIPAFQSDGKFNTQAYRTMLGAQGLTPERFEAQMRRSLEIDQMREAITDTAFMVPVERDQLMQAVGQLRLVRYAELNVGSYAGKIQISDDAAKQQYEDSKSQYMAPERIKLSYVELSQDNLPTAKAPSDDELKALYSAEKAGRFTTPEQRKVSHILIKFGADKAAAKKKAEAIKAQLDGGADFVALAKQDSEDAGSKAKGGDLGWLKRGDMPESFEKTEWSLKKGETSDPVETEFGWHLIHIDDIKPATVKPFDDPDVKRELTQLYQNKEKQQHFQDLSDKLDQLAFENPTSLEPVAKQLGLKVETTDWFTREGGEGIAANDAVKQTAFSQEVLKDDENSKPITLNDSTLVVVRKNQYDAPRQRTFDEVKDQVIKSMQEAQGKTQAEADAKAMIADLKAGKSLDEVAKAKSAEVKDAGALSSNDTNADPALVKAAFKIPHPADGKDSYGEATLKDGNLAVMVLSKIVPAPAQAMPSAAQFNQLAAGKEYEAFRDNLADEIKVKIVNSPADAIPDPESE
ncbi:SurA N-terminal domain-containing protein [Solimonas marina]|uniref:Periplasmic chaperone PpiD n=1 Tax=Solimonas marina TaxID=2714601 RepID=A0A970B7D1_9GAMM|nr:SurA N-terminal domain-containing protein [Solimonas marina]NKF23768.1 hypothetical protein [Solimonas marina]